MEQGTVNVGNMSPKIGLIARQENVPEIVDYVTLRTWLEKCFGSTVVQFRARNFPIKNPEKTRKIMWALLNSTKLVATVKNA